jgi:hypothetical protein
LVDTPASGAGDRKVVEVRVFFWAPIQTKPSLVLGFVFSAFEILDHPFDRAMQGRTDCAPFRRFPSNVRRGIDPG